MWKAPHRATNEVTQQYNDGVVKIYEVNDIASPGHKPVERLSFKGALRYEEKRLGINRYYSGQQNQVQIERVVRTPRQKNVSSQDVAITEDGKQYRINLIQSVQDVFPPSIDITLAKMEQKYEVPG